MFDFIPKLTIIFANYVNEQDSLASDTIYCFGSNFTCFPFQVNSDTYQLVKTGTSYLFQIVDTKAVGRSDYSFRYRYYQNNLQWYSSIFPFEQFNNDDDDYTYIMFG